MILIGTSGFSYDDWKGHFYPDIINKRDMLSFYSKHFPAVEINSTYYVIPGASSFRAMADRTPGDFRFVVKAHQDMTHREKADPDAVKAFLLAIEPLRETGKLGCVLAQFPWSFRPGKNNIERLYDLHDKLDNIPAVIEFRNSDWIGEETCSLLRELGFGYCCVDEPDIKGLMPKETALTSDIGYIRFHGRNSAQWWKHEHAWERYNYLYSEDELTEWVSKITALDSEAETTYLFFNNHYQGKSARNAVMLAKMLSIELGKGMISQPGLFD